MAANMAAASSVPSSLGISMPLSHRTATVAAAVGAGGQQGRGVAAPGGVQSPATDELGYKIGSVKNLWGHDGTSPSAGKQPMSFEQ